jgi:uncharacterized protein
MILRAVVPLLLAALATNWTLHSAEPLRVFLRAGVKTHGPGQHDHPRFLEDWRVLLGQRGMRVDGGLEFPTVEQLGRTDVLVIYAADGMHITGGSRVEFEGFLRRGGGLVVIHDGVVSGDQHDWARRVQGGAWRWDLPPERRTKWFEGEVGIYFVDTDHPITRGISNFDWTDEIYYDLDMDPQAHVLATSFHSVFVLAPQLWTLERAWEGSSTPYRAFVSLPGHEFDVFDTPQYRVLLLRGIAWAGRRANVDEFCRPEELSEQALKYPPGGPTAPDRAHEALNVHPEFELRLVAAEPLIEKVISIDWDPEGRLWVAETPEYPGGRTTHPHDAVIAIRSGNQPGSYGRSTREDRPARDRISWLEDTTGDGRMDRKHIFADHTHGVPGGLERVTSIVFHRDGVIAQVAPDILWLRDTTGDGVCDTVERLYTGFGIQDTHAVINNMRWGLDGWIYSAVGYSAGHPRSGDGARDFGRITAGIIRFRPDGSALEQVVSGACNTWGFDFGPDGEMFYTTATCGEHLLHIVLPDPILARASVGGIRGSWVAPDHQHVSPSVQHRRPAYMQIDWVGSFTATSGSCIYNGGAWPERFNGSHFCSEPTVNIVHHEFLAPTNTTFVASKESGREQNEFMAGTDLWFRPIHTRVGPDGALYVVDFYNQAVIHNDTRGPPHGAHNAATRPDRDHHFARLWRIQHRQATTLPRPQFTPTNPEGVAHALRSPNGWTRDTAARLLRENPDVAPLAILHSLLADSTLAGPSRIAALHTLEALRALDDDTLLRAARDPEPVLRRSALRTASERDHTDDQPAPGPVRALLTDPDPRARLWALVALGTCAQTAETAGVLIDVWPTLHDPYHQSAALGVAARDPLLFLDTAYAAVDPRELAGFVRHVARLAGLLQDPALARSLVLRAARAPVRSDALKQAALEALAGSLRPGGVPVWDDELRQALLGLVGSPRPELAGAALPLVARWDTTGTLAADLRPLIAQLVATLENAALADDVRGQVAVNLLGVRRWDESILPRVGGLLGTGIPPGLQRRIIDALGATADPGAGHVLIAAYSRVPAELRELLFGAVVRRADWALSLIQALADERIPLALVGPANLFRLRTHPDATVAQRATAVVEVLQGPALAEKDALIAQLRPMVEQPGGDPLRGRQLFLDNCVTCHVFKGEGRDLAPDLTGMGAHGPADLLMHILDPNRVVEPNFLSTSIETLDDFAYDGVVVRETSVDITLRNATADYTIRKDNIASRRSTGLSLMPEGYEALGGDALRDLIAYLCADEQRFRIVDLAAAFTVNTRAGIYASREQSNDAPTFRQHGLVRVGEVPFDIVSPERAAANAIVLRGGSGFAKDLPQQVEARVGLAARRLYFLGGIGGWAWPSGGESTLNLPVAKATLHFADGRREEMIFRNGVEFADLRRVHDVPGSAGVPGLARRGQIRWFSREVQGRGVIERLTLASYDNSVAPTFIAITAERADGERDLPSGTQAAAAMGALPGAGTAATTPLRALIFGGGSAHDFDRWFDRALGATLRAVGQPEVDYSDQPDRLSGLLAQADVLFQTSNQALPSPATREAIFNFTHAGKGLVLLHAGLWYNWPDWPDYNRLLCGGGARGHDRFGEFEVQLTEAGRNHPLLKGVPARFTIADELYWFERDPEGTPITVLATAWSAQKQATYPVIFTVDHPSARIAAITLGHDGQAHHHEAFRRLVQNALQWAGGGIPDLPKPAGNSESHRVGEPARRHTGTPTSTVPVIGASARQPS